MDYYRKMDYKDAQRWVPEVDCENNVHKMEVFTNAYYAACDIIGGNENTMSDCEPDSEDYKAAERYLANHEALVQDIYYEAVHGYYGSGFAGPGRDMVKHYRFAGKAWTLDAVEKIVRSMGH